MVSRYLVFSGSQYDNELHIMESVNEWGCVLLCFQDFCHSCCGLVCGVARLRHKQASWAAYLIWRHMHVHCACIPPVSTQDCGEFCNESFTASSQGCIITVVTTVSKHARYLKCYLWSVLLRLLISFDFVPLSSQELAEVLPCNNWQPGDSLMP